MSNDTHLLKQSQTTIGHLRITAHIGKLLSLFCLLSGIFYLKLFFFWWCANRSSCHSSATGITCSFSRQPDTGKKLGQFSFGIRFDGRRDRHDGLGNARS